MKVLFLDFDGVLNSESYFRHLKNTDKPIKEQKEALCPMLIGNLIALMEAVPDMKIVISSTWRCYFPLPWLQATLGGYGVDQTRIIDTTDPKMDRSWGFSRGECIQAWLSQHPEVTQYAVVDDDPDMEEVKHRFVKTSMWDGLTLSKASTIAKLFDVETEAFW
jgi:hypothetical protein